MILYLHGFLSTGDSAKGRWFEEAFAQHNIPLIRPTYPVSSPAKSLALLEYEIHRHGLNETNQPWMLMGASMGGFYAQYLADKYRVPLVMINPALQASVILAPYLGAHVHPQTGEEFEITPDYLQALQRLQLSPIRNSPSLVLLDKGDEEIPYEPTLKAYEHVGEVVCFEGGSHAFEHLDQAWPKVLEFTKRSLGLH